LQDFLTEAGLEIEDVYNRGCWSALKRAAGLDVAAAGPHEETIGRRLSRLLHMDDDVRLSAYSRALAEPGRGAGAGGAGVGGADRRLLTGLHFALIDDISAVSSIEGSLSVLHQHPALVAELQELLPILDARAEHLTYPLDAELGWDHKVPLSVHARYSTEEIVSAFGLLDIGRRTWTQTGVFFDDTTNTDFFLVTLEKSEREYSPTTRYKDYAISPVLFHWESQSTTSQRSGKGQRYIRHRERGGHIMLFVRQRKRDGARTLPYTLLGPADYVSHQGERPIQFVWKLRRPMPADFFSRAKVVGA
jgi:hypothetical protein